MCEFVCVYVYICMCEHVYICLYACVCIMYLCVCICGMYVRISYLLYFGVYVLENLI